MQHPVFFLFACLLALLFAGCSGSSDSSPSTPPPDDSSDDGGVDYWDDEDGDPPEGILITLTPEDSWPFVGEVTTIIASYTIPQGAQITLVEWSVVEGSEDVTELTPISDTKAKVSFAEEGEHRVQVTVTWEYEGTPRVVWYSAKLTARAPLADG